jgi:hypothetical protein
MCHSPRRRYANAKSFQSNTDCDGYSNSYLYAYAYTNTDSYSHAYANGYSYCYGNSYSHGNCNGNAYANPYPTTYTYAKRYCQPKATSDTAASPVAGEERRDVSEARGADARSGGL